MRVASSWAEGGGLVAAELKKNDDETDGNEEVEPESGLSGRDTAGLAVDDIQDERHVLCSPVALLSAVFNHLCNVSLQVLVRSYHSM